MQKSNASVRTAKPNEARNDFAGEEVKFKIFTREKMTYEPIRATLTLTL